MSFYVCISSRIYSNNSCWGFSKNAVSSSSRSCWWDLQGILPVMHPKIWARIFSRIFAAIILGISDSIPPEITAWVLRRIFGRIPRVLFLIFFSSPLAIPTYISEIIPGTIPPGFLVWTTCRVATDILHVILAGLPRDIVSEVLSMNSPASFNLQGDHFQNFSGNSYGSFSKDYWRDSSGSSSRVFFTQFQEFL